MAEHKVQGGTMLLFIDPAGGTNYDTVVCLTSVGKTDSIDPVDASSACGPDKSPGKVAISYSFEGQHLQDPDTGKISGTSLRQLLRAKTFFGFKISPVTPVAGDEIEEGVGYFSELSSTYSFDSVGTFSGVIQPVGQPTISISGTPIPPPIPETIRFYLNYNNNWGGNIFTILGSSPVTISMTIKEVNNPNNIICSYSSSGIFQTSDPAFIYPPNPGLYFIDFTVSNLSIINFISAATNIGIYNFDFTQMDSSTILSGGIYLQFQELTTQKINDLLSLLVSFNYGGGILQINLQSPLAPPTGQGITDKNTLIANGWTVTTD